MKKLILSICMILGALIYFNKFQECFGKNTGILPAEHSKFKIGDSFQGGIIAYILKETDTGYDAKVPHGIIAAPSDQSKAIQWYNGTYTKIGAKGTALGSGQANTNAIINNQGEGSYAAKLCADLVIGEYSDWYLPSKDELNLLFLNKDIIGSFSTGTYWSSTEDSKVFYVWRQGFFSGSQTSDDKKEAYEVRAVRSF
jgi:hypothetical protein